MVSIMSRIIFLLSLVTALLLVTSGNIHAQRHAGYCDSSTRTTADALDCINRQKQDVQERLNKIYKVIAERDHGVKDELLAQAQQSWRSYRDNHCAWEASLATNPSLNRVYELSCLTLLTNLRSDLLSTTVEQEEDDMPREFSSSPRWMNVLVHDYPDIFWRYGKWLHADIDCDGDNEHVMTGVRVSMAEATNSIDVVVAVTDNPVVGKPDPQLFYVPVNGNSDDEKSLCSADISMALSAHPLNVQEAPSCDIALKIIDNACSPLTLYWAGSEYALSHSTSQPGDE
jgi:uncharacterized protein YecT (DUF1311 family)